MERGGLALAVVCQGPDAHLLGRPTGAGGGSQAALDVRVITSYSIHYTKLYEGLLPRRKLGRAAGSLLLLSFVAYTALLVIQQLA